MEKRGSMAKVPSQTQSWSYAVCAVTIQYAAQYVLDFSFVQKNKKDISFPTNNDNWVDMFKSV